MTMQHESSTAPAVASTKGLCWAIKSTFATYVESMSDGNIAVFDGAERMSDGSFFFPFAQEREAGSAVVRSFRGGVQFTGHRGMLAVTISAIELIIEDGSASLSIEDGLSPDGRLTMVAMDNSNLEGEVIRFPAPKLTEDGADLFFENYPAGTEFEPIWLLPTR